MGVRGAKCLRGAGCRGPRGAPLVGVKADVRGVPVGTRHKKCRSAASAPVPASGRCCFTLPDPFQES